MGNTNIQITLVSKKEPGTSGKFTDRIVREVLSDLMSNHPEIEIRDVFENEIDEDISKALQIHQFPAIIINGKQITAGSVVTLSKLEEIISGL